MDTQENRNAYTIQFARASAAFLVMLVMGYAFSTTPVESASDSELPAVTSWQEATPYFPAQYTNQGAGGEEHIQAF
jgi:hypothetical protein